MSRVHSRRNILLFAPGAVALSLVARGVFAQNPPLGGQTINNPIANRPGGAGGGGVAPGPGPAVRGGDFEPGKAGGMNDKAHSDPPPNPRKDLAADQRSMRGEVQQLVRDTQELKNAIEQLGPKQPLPAELIGKTRGIEKLARDIVVLAKG
jgi:hypothetical protein